MSKLKKLNKLNKSKTLSVALAVGLVASNLVSVVPAFAATHSSAQVRSVANKIVATTPTMINALDPQDLIVEVITENELNTIKYGKTEIPFTPNDDGTVTIFGTDLIELLSNGTKSLKFDFASGSDKTLRVAITDKDATISSKYATFNNKNGRGKDVSVSVKSYGLTLSQITNDETPLDSDAYEVGDLSSSGIIKVTLKKEYLSTLENKPAELYFEFVGGETAPKITVRVSGNDENQAATIRSVSVATDTETDTVTVDFSKAITEADVEDLVLTQKVDASDAQTLDAAFTLADDGLSATAEVASVVATTAEQTVVYSVSYNGGAAKTATITVAAKTDTEKPVITLLGDATMNLKVGDTFTDPGVTITDNVDADLVAVVTGDVVDTAKAGTYVIKYNVSDAAKNAADEVTRTVVVAEVDAEKPVITLLGDATMNLKVGDTFTDPGVTITDNVDADLVAVVTGDVVDTAKAGTYVIKYNVSDKAGNAAAEVTRTVVVAEVMLGVSSVGAITKTSVTVVLAAGSDAIKAADKAAYTVKIGEEVVPVTAVAYTAATNTAVLTVDLDKKEGNLTVNTVGTAAIDYKAPEIKTITAVSSTQFDITYSEAVNGGLAQVKSNYALVQAGTANVLTGEITGVVVLSPTKVRVSLNANKLVKDTSYTVTVSNMQDVSVNKNTMTLSSSMNFVAIKDETKPTLVSAIATDADKIVLTMSEEMKTAGIATVKKYKTDGTLDTAVNNAVALDPIDKTKMIITISNSADYMVNGTNYEVTISGGSDLEGNVIEVSQKSDVVGLRDDVAPTVAKSTFADNKLTIAFSEKMNMANAAYYVFNASTGAPVNTFTVTKNTDSTEAYLTFNAGSLKASTNYAVTINGQKDAAITPNDLAADTIVMFKTDAAAVTPVKVTGAAAGTDGISVVLTLAGTFTKEEAETLANYAIVDATDTTKVLAVTKATYNSPTQVTLTTAAQEEGTANYKVIISKFANLSTVATDTTLTYSGVDKVKPTVTGVELLGLSNINLIFSETMLANQAGAVVSAVETGTANVITSALGQNSGLDNKVRVVFSSPLTAGKNYTVTITGAKDKASTANLSDAQTVTFVAVADATAPSIANVASVNSATIEIAFNEDVAITGTLAAPNFVIKQGINTVSWGANTTFAIDPTNNKKLTIVNGGGSPVALFENGTAYTVTVVADPSNYLADISGNKVDNMSYAFTGVKDTVKPTVVSATMLSTDDTKLVITFSEKIKSNVFDAANYIVTNANTGVPISVTGEAVGTGEKANQITLTFASSTVKGTSYRVYVANAGTNKITDLAVVPNLVDSDNAIALFTGIDTLAPTVGTATMKLTSASTMTLTFGEKLDPSSVTATDFSVDALTVANAVVQANGMDVVLTFTGNTDTGLTAPVVKLVAGAKIADATGNEAIGAAITGTTLSGAYTDAAKPNLVKAEVTANSGALIAGQDGLYSVRKASEAAIGLVTLTFTENLLSTNLTLQVYNSTGVVSLSPNTLADIKNILVGNQDNVKVFTNDVAATYAEAKSLMNGLAGTAVTKLVFGFKDSAANEGSFTFLVD